MWLILRVGENFEHTLVPGNAMEARSPPGGDGGPTYILREPTVPGAELVLSIAPPRSMTELEDLGTLEALWRQYGVLPHGSGLDGVQAPSFGGATGFGGDSKGGLPSYGAAGGDTTGGYRDEKGHHGAGAAAVGGAAAGAAAAPLIHGGGAGDLRNKLVLVDQETGAVISELDSQPALGQADAADVANQDPTKPVMIDFGPIVAHTREVRVTRIPPDELDDWMLRGADSISRGILGVSSVASGAMQRRAEKYRATAVPRPAPVKMGAVTSSLKNVHGATTTGARVTGKTTAMINQTVERLVSKKQKGGQVYAAPQAPKQSTFGKLKQAAAPAAASAMGWAKEKAAAYQAGTAGTTGATGTGACGDAPAPAYGTTGTGNAPGFGNAPPPLPPRGKSPVPGAYDQGQGQGLHPGSAGGYGAGYDEKHGHLAPGAPPSPGGSGATTPTRKKRPLLNRTLLAADVILSSLEAAANEMVTTGTHAASTAVGAKYGNDAGAAVAYTGASVRNAVLVYVDVRGIGRRSVLKATAKGWVKARLKNGETVQLAPVPVAGAAGAGQQPTTDQHGHAVVGVPMAPEKR